MPFPTSIRLVSKLTVLSALTLSHESTCVGSGVLPAEMPPKAFARPGSAPATEKPTRSAPLPARNERRESSAPPLRADTAAVAPLPLAACAGRFRSMASIP